jgi:large subunit ribosomal protein L7A
MSYDKVKQARKLSIGTKQTLRMLEAGKAAEVYVASDADAKVTSKVIQLCQKKGVKITYVDSKKKLGKACGIEVSAAVAAVCKEE